VSLPLVIVAAVAENGVIGRGNELAFRIGRDLKRFKEITWGRPLIMGRKTYQSIGKPLPGRETIVLTRDPGFAADGVMVAHDWAGAVAVGEAAARRMGAPEIVIAGGGEVYRLALPQAERLRLTIVHARPDGDAFFPPCDRAAFDASFEERHGAGPRDEHPFTFLDLVRRPAAARR